MPLTESVALRRTSALLLSLLSGAVFCAAPEPSAQAASPSVTPVELAAAIEGARVAPGMFGFPQGTGAKLRRTTTLGCGIALPGGSVAAASGGARTGSTITVVSAFRYRSAVTVRKAAKAWRTGRCSTQPAADGVIFTRVRLRGMPVGTVVLSVRDSTTAGYVALAPVGPNVVLQTMADTKLKPVNAKKFRISLTRLISAVRTAG